jgi:hypothetical protein
VHGHMGEMERDGKIWEKNARKVGKMCPNEKK